MSMNLHRISSRILAVIRFHDEERILGELNRTSSRLPDPVQIQDEEKKSDPHSSESLSSTGFDNAATKNLVRKLDLRLVPILSTIYLYDFMSTSL